MPRPGSGFIVIRVVSKLMSGARILLVRSPILRIATGSMMPAMAPAVSAFRFAMPIRVRRRISVGLPMMPVARVVVGAIQIGMSLATR